MDFAFTLIKKDERTRARTGVISTPHGNIETPCFTAVGTRANVKTLDPVDLKNSLTQAVLANTYHLYLRPGVDVIEHFGGVAPFMKWEGPTITDSGGYQVSFLWVPKEGNVSRNRAVKINDKGALFRSHIDGTQHLLTPEKSMEIQKVLAADIIMAFDQPLSLDNTKNENMEAFKRSMLWEKRSYLAWLKQNKRSIRGTEQALYGIIEGQTDKKLRIEFIKFILDLGFPGIAIGDETIGVDPELTAKSLDAVAEYLPDNKPLHALGLGGGPEGIFVAVERGVDTFDNTSVTRMARTGLLYIHPEDGGKKQHKFRIDIKRSFYKKMNEPVSNICECYTCRNFSKAYLQHLMANREVLGLRLATIHNVHFINNLMVQIRTSINKGDYGALREHWLS